MSKLTNTHITLLLHFTGVHISTDSHHGLITRLYNV